MSSTALVPTSGAAAMQLAFELGAVLESDGLAPREGVAIEHLTYQEWENIGRALAFIGEAWQWGVGDWMNWGESLFGEEAAQAADPPESRYDMAHRVTGLEPGTLQNIASVCRRVAKSRRRTPPLGFWIHAEVAALDPDEQDEWLNEAVEAGMSRSTLRAAIREAKAPSAADPDPPLPTSDGLSVGERIEAAARLVFAQAQSTSDGSVLVPAAAWAQLAAALGEER